MGVTGNECDTSARGGEVGVGGHSVDTLAVHETLAGGQSFEKLFWGYRRFMVPNN